MEKSIKVSVIVPVYNVEKYLSQCLDSIFNQSLEEIEVIIVNDGSTDNSYEILKKYANKKNVKIIDKLNGGLSSARNIGLKSAIGEYIAFVDSDDFIHENMYEEMYNISQGAEIVFCDYSKFKSENFNQSDILKKLYLFQENKEYLGIEIYKHELVTVWNKIYRREFIEKNNLSFVEGIIHEDDEFSLKTFTKAKTVKFIKKIFYFYRLDNLNSITKAIDFNKKEKAYSEVLKTIEKLTKENDNEFKKLRLYIKKEKYKALKKEKIDINLIVNEISEKMKKLKCNDFYKKIILDDLLDLFKEKEVIRNIEYRKIFILKDIKKILKAFKYRRKARI